MTLCPEEIFVNLTEFGMSKESAESAKWNVYLTLRKLGIGNKLTIRGVPWKVCFALMMKKYGDPARAFRICGSKKFTGKPVKGKKLEDLKTPRACIIYGKDSPQCKEALKKQKTIHGGNQDMTSIREEKFDVLTLEEALLAVELKKGGVTPKKRINKKKDVIAGAIKFSSVRKEISINEATKLIHHNLEASAKHFEVDTDVLLNHLEDDECPYCHWIDLYELGKFNPNMESCIGKLKGQGKSKSSAIGICTDTMKKAKKPIH